MAVQVAMEIAYLCAARQKDVLKLKWADILEDGVFIKQRKTGRKKINGWSPDLKAAIENAKKLPGICSTVWVISNRKGKQYTRSGFKAMWGKTMNKAMRICRRKSSETDEVYKIRAAKFQVKYPPRIKERFTYHDK